MRRFHNASEISPRGSWHYFYDPNIPSTRVQRNSEQEIFDEVKRWRINNGRFAGDEDLRDEMWNYWCSREPNRCGSRDKPAATPHQIGWRDVWNFARMIERLVAQGKAFVSQQEAEDRAAICIHCPMNQQINTDCEKCRVALVFISEKIAGKKTSVDHQLKACAICGCELRSAVHLDLQAQQSVLTPEMVNRFKTIPICWKKPQPTE
jgi:hypothetical protein